MIRLGTCSLPSRFVIAIAIFALSQGSLSPGIFRAVLATETGQEAVGTSRTNPARIGEEVLSGDLGITVLEVKRGQGARVSVMAANPYNPELSEDEEYVLVFVRLRNAGASVGPREDLLLYYNWGVTGSSNVPRTIGAVAPAPVLDTVKAESLLPGAEVEGWIAKRVGVDESDLQFVFLGQQSQDWRYIALDDSSRLPIESDSTPLIDVGATDVGLSRDDPATFGNIVVMPPYAVEILDSAQGTDALRLLSDLGSTELPDQGYEFVLIWIRVTNVATSEVPVLVESYGLFRLSGSSGIIRDPELNLLSFIDVVNPAGPLTDFGEWIYPGGSIEGWTLFMVEQGENDLVLSVEPMYEDDARFIAFE